MGIVLAEEKRAGVKGVPAAEARGELERLLSDTRFRATERARAVLTYLAERAFEGHTEGVKAYAIALDVLGRPSSFDPNMDPIVRIELSRLRSALGTYYDAYGSETGIRIDLPVGRYLAVFSRTTSAPDPEPVEEEQDVAPLSAVSAEKRRRGLHWPLAASLVIVLVGVAAGIGLSREKAPLHTLRPYVRLSVSPPDTQYEEEARLFGDHLITAISRFQTVALVPSDENVEALRTSATEDARNDYRVNVEYYGGEADRSIWWRITDVQDGSVLASGVETASIQGRSEAEARNDLVAALARKVAASRGVIGTTEAAPSHMPSAGEARAIGNRCVLFAEYALDEGTQAEVASALRCLEETLRSDPGDADAAAVLSRTLLETTSVTTMALALRRADELASNAASIEPSADRTRVALMLAQLYRGSAGAAIESGNRALALNPNNPDVLAKFALVLFQSGFRDGARFLAQDASRDMVAVPRDARLVLALDAFCRADYSNASLLAEQIGRVDVVVSALRAAALGEIGSRMAPARLASLGALLPNHQEDFAAWMARRAFSTKLIGKLQRGLMKAGNPS
jgi:tetratricopeptide (TPR) repeat protein